MAQATTQQFPRHGLGITELASSLSQWAQLAHFTIGDNPLNHSIFGTSIAMKIALVKSPNTNKRAYYVFKQVPFGTTVSKLYINSILMIKTIEKNYNFVLWPY